MFQRVCYKKLAKKQLKGRRFTAVAAVFISSMLLMLVGSITDFSESSSQEFSNTENIAFIEEVSPEYYFESFETSTSPLDGIAFLLNLAILGITEVALCHLFNVYFCNPEQKILFSEFLKGFSLWLKGFLSILWFSLWTFLWSLLFIIPGIVKAFSYSQCFMIIAENPGISVRKALKISKTMTAGFKSDLFVMCLSFIGWEILSVFTLFILQLWLIPYERMAFTNAYKDMKSQAIKKGILSPDDFK